MTNFNEAEYRYENLSPPEDYPIIYCEICGRDHYPYEGDYVMDYDQNREIWICQSCLNLPPEY